MKYAFIGSRNMSAVPSWVREVTGAALDKLVLGQHTLATGAADGFDILSAIGYLKRGGEVDFYLPTEDYKSEVIDELAKKYPAKIGVRPYYPEFEHCKPWTASVDKYHPNPGALTPFARKLMARNYGIIEGCEAVIAAPRPPEQGGTAQGIRIARDLGIRVYNISVTEGRDALLAKLK